MNEPIVETPINAHYKEFVSHEAEELTEEWNTMGISITFDVDTPEV